MTDAERKKLDDQEKRKEGRDLEKVLDKNPNAKVTPGKGDVYEGEDIKSVAVNPSKPTDFKFLLGMPPDLYKMGLEEFYGPGNTALSKKMALAPGASDQDVIDSMGKAQGGGGMSQALPGINEDTGGAIQARYNEALYGGPEPKVRIIDPKLFESPPTPAKRKQVAR
jgi:hypothetical protein